VTERLAGKVAFITGAARGQGRSHAVRLAAEGADIIAVDLCAQIATVPYPMSVPEDLEQTVKEVEALGRRIVARQADVRDFDSLRVAFEAGYAELGRVDIVLANAGIVSFPMPEEDPWQAYLDTIEVNLHGTRNALHVAVEHLIEQGDGGAVVLTSSTQGLTGRGGTGSGGTDGYVASKHAVVGLMRSWANWLAPYSIRVNTVHPTGVNTPMLMNEVTEEYIRQAPASAGPAMANMLPVDLIQPIDISNAIAWLVSDEARYVTGVTLPVDAGFSAK
jgi:SDR family mycofactocin-dependent oxidoreductase